MKLNFEKFSITFLYIEQFILSSYDQLYRFQLVNYFSYFNKKVESENVYQNEFTLQINILSNECLHFKEKNFERNEKRRRRKKR